MCGSYVKLKATEPNDGTSPQFHIEPLAQNARGLLSPTLKTLRGLLLRYFF
jgi:hypothetical protein